MEHKLKFITLLFTANIAIANMSGWNHENINELSSVLSNSLMSGAKMGYYQRAENVGNLNPKPFPESEAKESFDLLSQCVSKVASEKWTYDDFMNNQQTYVKQLLGDAISGGVCRPTGLIGKAVDSRKMD